MPQIAASHGKGKRSLNKEVDRLVLGVPVDAGFFAVATERAVRELGFGGHDEGPPQAARDAAPTPGGGADRGRGPRVLRDVPPHADRHAGQGGDAGRHRPPHDRKPVGVRRRDAAETCACSTSPRRPTSGRCCWATCCRRADRDRCCSSEAAFLLPGPRGCGSLARCSCSSPCCSRRPRWRRPRLPRSRRRATIARRSRPTSTRSSTSAASRTSRRAPGSRRTRRSWPRRSPPACAARPRRRPRRRSACSPCSARSRGPRTSRCSRPRCAARSRPASRSRRARRDELRVAEPWRAILREQGAAAVPALRGAGRRSRAFGSDLRRCCSATSSPSRRPRRWPSWSRWSAAGTPELRQALRQALAKRAQASPADRAALLAAVDAAIASSEPSRKAGADRPARGARPTTATRRSRRR
jgi:hypothetical protein